LEEMLWPAEGPAATVFATLAPLLRGVGDIGRTHMLGIDDNLALVPGDLALSRFEDELSSQWPACLDGKERGFRVISAFRRLIDAGAERFEADLVLVDVGPNLGAINRAALVAADHVVVPLAPDLFSLQGLRNLGPTLREWRKGWQERLPKNPEPTLDLPAGGMQPLGYVLQQHGIRLGVAVGAYQRWMGRIPGVYLYDVLAEDGDAPPIEHDPHCLAQLKHYRSLMPMAQDARKPVFALKPADGAFGGHQAAVRASYADFAALAQRIAGDVGVALRVPG
jgi:chromosome partitioning protein